MGDLTSCCGNCVYWGMRGDEHAKKEVRRCRDPRRIMPQLTIASDTCAYFRPRDTPQRQEFKAVGYVEKGSIAKFFNSIGEADKWLDSQVGKTCSGGHVERYVPGIGYVLTEDSEC